MNLRLLAFQAIGLACCYFFLKLILTVPLFRKQMKRILRLSASGVTSLVGGWEGGMGQGRASNLPAGCLQVVVGSPAVPYGEFT